MDLEETNYRQLYRRYYEETSARSGAAVLGTFSDSKLATLLESHWVRPPSPADITKREAVDYFLHFVSVLEVAAISNCLPRDIFASAEAQHWLELLSKPALRRYYVNYYPLALPQMFRQRLIRNHGYEVEESFGDLSRFLDLSERRFNEQIDVFLWMVDDGVTDDDFDLSDVLATFVNEEKFVKTMAKPPKQRNGRDEGVHGLIGFTTFCRDFERLLKDCADKPLLQSAFWHCHGYWFRQMGPHLVGIIGAVIERYRERVAPVSRKGRSPGATAEELERIADTYKDMDAAHASMRRLVSGIYSEPLDSTLLVPKPLYAGFILSGEEPSERKTLPTKSGDDFSEYLIVERHDEPEPAEGLVDQVRWLKTRVSELSRRLERLEGTGKASAISTAYGAGRAVDLPDEPEKG